MSLPSTPFKRTTLISNLGKEVLADTFQQLMTCLGSYDIDIVIDESNELLAKSYGLKTIAKADIPNFSDLVIVIGGDGTMLATANALCTFDIPLLGINAGRLGFLSDVRKEAIASDLDEILSGNFQQDIRSMLEVDILYEKQSILETQALNDAVIHKWNTPNLITLETYVDNMFVHSQRADGMIVSTPTGSTAYALSSGGPIIHPNVNALLLVPICPHSLGNRPIVVSGDSQIDIFCSEGANLVQLTCDGRSQRLLKKHDHIRIKKSTHSIRLIHPPRHDPFFVLQEKLQWGIDFVNRPHHT